MRIFVASWFFPPATSSEAIVAYKLLRNSRHSYDVCCAESSLWSYKQELPLDAGNISVYPIKTDSLDEWVQGAVDVFEKLNEANHYDAIMTRSMPPESVNVAKLVREKHPDIPWIASLADPIAKAHTISRHSLTTMTNYLISKKEISKSLCVRAVRVGRAIVQNL